jgi:hypothetical protein
MADTFLTRIPTLSDAELRAYLDAPGRYKLEAVEAAAAELARRGHALPDLEAIRAQVRARDAAAPLKHGFLRDARGPRMDRIRIIAGALLASGLAAAGVIYRHAASLSTFDLQPENSKSYFRNLEMMGGKANVVATGIRQWFTGLWQGTTLAFTVFWLCAAAAGVFWLAATRKGPRL